MPEQPRSPGETSIAPRRGDRGTAARRVHRSRSPRSSRGPEVERQAAARRASASAPGSRSSGWRSCSSAPRSSLPVAARSPTRSQDRAPAADVKAGPSLDHPFGRRHHRVATCFSRVIWGTRNSLFIGVRVGRSRASSSAGASGSSPATSGARSAGSSARSSTSCSPSPAGPRALDRHVPRAHASSNVTLALAIVSTPILARIARASTLSWSEREFVLAAPRPGRASTAGSWSARSCPTCCRRCSRSRCSASPSSSSPRAASRSSAPA